ELESRSKHEKFEYRALVRARLPPHRARVGSADPEVRRGSLATNARCIRRKVVPHADIRAKDHALPPRRDIERLDLVREPRARRPRSDATAHRHRRSLIGK